MLIKLFCRKTFCIFFFFILIFSYCNNSVYANTKKLDINARSYVVLDRKSKKVLIGKNEYNRVKMASTTKIMTATVILENCNLNDIVTVSKKAGGTGGSRLGLKANDKISVHDLLYGLLLCSGNDAAVALAEHVSGSILGFCELMNSKAKELGMSNTHFETPHGLDSDGHYTTAYELALITDYALQNTTFRKIVETKNYTVNINGYHKSLLNTNELLGVVNGIYGVKTGFTNGANRCLVTGCKRGEMDIICVVLGCDTKKFRGEDSIKLIDYCFDTFEYFNIENFINAKIIDWKNDNSDYFNIYKGISNNLDITYSKIDSPIIPIEKNRINSLEIKFNINKNLSAPISNNYIIGNYEIYSGQDVIYSGNIISNSSIDKKNTKHYFTNFFKYYSYILNKVNIF